MTLPSVGCKSEQAIADRYCRSIEKKKKKKSKTRIDFFIEQCSFYWLYDLDINYEFPDTPFLKSCIHPWITAGAGAASVATTTSSSYKW